MPFSLPTTASSESVAIDVHSLSTRDLADALLAAFGAGERVLLSGQEWKRPSVEAVLDTVASATGVQGVWEWQSVAPPPVVLPVPPAVEPEVVQAEPLDLPYDTAALAAAAQWPDLTAELEHAAWGQYGTEELHQAGVTPSPGNESHEQDGDTTGGWNDWDWAETADSASEEAQSEQGDTHTGHETHASYEQETYGPVEEVIAPEPAREPLPPVEGDVIANAAYALIAFQQPVMLPNLRPRPASVSVSMSTPTMIDGNPMEFLRELAALDEL